MSEVTMIRTRDVIILYALMFAFAITITLIVPAEYQSFACGVGTGSLLGILVTMIVATYNDRSKKDDEIFHNPDNE